MNEERAHEIVEHLQTAALELIAAARAVLDLAEEVVRDPSEAIAFASAVAARVPPPGPPPGLRDDGGQDIAARVERIRVS
jgi:hypothetical protein